MDWNRLDRTLDKTLDKVNTVHTVSQVIGKVLLGLFFFLIGAGLLGYAVYWYIDRTRSMDEYVLAQGTVSAMKEQKDAEGSGYVYAPIVIYKAGDGMEYTYYSGHFSYPPAYDKGDKIEIYYKRTHPGEAFINSFMEKWFTGLITGTMGIVFFPIGIWLIISAFRRKQEAVKSFTRGNNYNSMLGVNANST
jgi:hypothetical protein